MLACNTKIVRGLTVCAPGWIAKPGFLVCLITALTQTGFAEVGPWNSPTGSYKMGRIPGASTGDVAVSMSTEAIELTQGEPLLMTYRISNGLSQTIDFMYRTPDSPLRLEVSQITASHAGKLAAKWPPPPKASPPSRLNLNAPLVFTFPRTEGCRLSSGRWIENTLIIPLQDKEGKPLAAGGYQMEVSVDLPIKVETAEYKGEVGQRKIISSPGGKARGKFRIALTVRPTNTILLTRSAKRLRSFAATEGTSNTSLYVDALLHFPADIAYANCRSLIYDDAVRGDRQRRSAIIQSLRKSDAPSSLDLLAQMAWRLKDEEAKQTLTRLYLEKRTAGDEETAAQIAAWFTKNHESVLKQMH